MIDVQTLKKMPTTAVVSIEYVGPTHPNRSYFCRASGYWWPVGSDPEGRRTSKELFDLATELGCQIHLASFPIALPIK